MDDNIESCFEESKTSIGRGMSLLTNKLDKQNLILVKGCKPGQGVKEDTKLIEDFAFCLKE